MGNKILVTGASGFTGRYMVRRLKEQGNYVVGIGRSDSGADVTLNCDLADAAKLKAVVNEVQPDKVVHLAAVSFVGHGDPIDFYRINVVGTNNLLSALAGLSITPSKVLIASSANIYGVPEVSEIDESIAPAPVNDYACSKLSMEFMAKTWKERLPIVIVRPFNYTGVGQDERFLIPKMVGHFARREPVIELGNIDVSRDFSSVNDIVDAYNSLLNTPCVSGDVFNVCSGKSYSLLTVLEWMKGITGHDIDVQVNPAFVRKNEIPILVGTYNKLERLNGWRPKQGFQAVVKEMLEFT